MRGARRPPAPSVTEVKHSLIGPTATFHMGLVAYRDAAPGQRSLIATFVLPRNLHVAEGVDLVKGGLTYGFFWEDRPYNVYLWLRPEGTPIGLYFNVGDGTRIRPDRVEWRDLVLDVLVPLRKGERAAAPPLPWSGWEPGEPAVLDRDEVPPGIDPDLLSAMEGTVDHILERHGAIWTEVRRLAAPHV